MNEKFNKNAKVEQLTNVFLSRGEEKGFIVKDPLYSTYFILCYSTQHDCFKYRLLNFVYFKEYSVC